MNNIALYRKYRPTTFDDVVGQDAIVQTLRNQIIYKRIANAYLFCGPRGTGKTSISRIFAKAMNCDNHINGNPCNNCQDCNSNVDIIEIDAASNNNVDKIRELIEEAHYTSINGKNKIYIIDEVHMLTGASFNALLKTLEEPPKGVVFILATTERTKVIPTIASRCQQYNFRNITEEAALSKLKDICLKENITYDSEESLKFLIKISDGAMRDCINYLDECASMSGNNITVDKVKDLVGYIREDVVNNIADTIERQDVKSLMDIVSEIYYEGKSFRQLCKSMYDYYRDKTYHNIDFEINLRRMRNFAELMEKVKDNRTVLEIGLIKICKPEMEKDYSSIIERLNRLEQGTYKPEEKPAIDYLKVMGYNNTIQCNTFLI